jgi:hypothetical protein
MRRLAFPDASVGASRRATTLFAEANAATNRALARATAIRAFSAGIDPDAGSRIPSQLHDAEHAREDMYFRAEDAKALEKLTRKARAQAREKAGEDPASSADASALGALRRVAEAQGGRLDRASKDRPHGERGDDPQALRVEVSPLRGEKTKRRIRERYVVCFVCCSFDEPTARASLAVRARLLNVLVSLQ